MNRIWLQFGRTLRGDLICPVRTFNQSHTNYEHDPFSDNSTRNNADSEGRRPHQSSLLFQPTFANYFGVIGLGVVFGVKLDHLQRTSDFFQVRRNHSLACPLITRAGPNNVAPHLPEELTSPLAILDSDHHPADFVDAQVCDVVDGVEDSSSSSAPSTSHQVDNSQGSSASSLKEDLSHLATAYTNTLCNLVGVRLLESSQKEGIDYLLSSPNYSRALFNLAVSYETGRLNGKASGQPDPVLAFEYYQRSSALGHDYATYNLSLYYLYGKYPAERDVSKGVRLLEKAFSLGVPEASVYRKMRHFVQS